MKQMLADRWHQTPDIPRFQAAAYPRIGQETDVRNTWSYRLPVTQIGRICARLPTAVATTVSIARPEAVSDSICEYQDWRSP